MRKILLPIILVLLSLASVYAVGYQVNVSFWKNNEQTQNYINEFMYVYVQHKNCQSYYLGGLNCTYECRHGRYASGTAIVENVTGNLAWDFYILQPASFDNATACPRLTNPIINYLFDQKVINQNSSYNYFLNDTVLPRASTITWNFRAWLIVGWWILTLVVVIVAGYFTMNGWACLIALIVMVILKLLLFG
jgi:hypothetical protein